MGPGDSANGARQHVITNPAQAHSWGDPHTFFDMAVMWHVGPFRRNGPEHFAAQCQAHPVHTNMDIVIYFTCPPGGLSKETSASTGRASTACAMKRCSRRDEVHERSPIQELLYQPHDVWSTLYQSWRKMPQGCDVFAESMAEAHTIVAG